MLKGIPTEISSELLKALADMGHGDILVIADDFYPPYSKTPNGRSINAKGNTAAEMLDAILKLFPLDTEYEAHPVEYMIPDADANINLSQRPKVWDECIKVCEKHGLTKEQVGEIERSKFYEKAGRAFVTVCTSEREAYGCFIIQKGVM